MSRRSAKWLLILFLVGLCVGGGYWLGRHTQGFKLPWEKSGNKPLEKPSQLVPQQLILPKGMADFEQRVMLAANKALPAVVNINTEKKVRFQPSPSPFFNDPFFRRFFGDQIPYFAPQEQIQRSLGSGVIVTQDGYILTNHHVIAGADVIKVSLIDKRVFDARVVGLDPKTDLALLKIDATDLPLLPLGDSSKLEVGQFVLAVGNPFGLSGTVTMGIVSAKGRANIRIADYEDFIQTDAPINPGNSGGALVNLDGELVGINTVIFSQSGGNIGIGFAIPSNMAKGVMYNLIEYGRVVRGWLGVAIQDQADGKGVIVQGVMPNSPAEKAGLKQGDIILSYRGESIESGSELKNLVGETAPGEKVEIKILRSGTEMTISVVIAELKEEEIPELSVMNKLGIRVEELKKELREQFGIPDEIKEGVVVIAVDEAGRAGEAGVEPGDVILRANQTLVRRLSDLEKALESAGDDQIILWVWRTPRTITLVIPPKE